VEAITIVTQPQRMYNFTVAAAHTYFVGDGQWLVHNCNTPSGRNLTTHAQEQALDRGMSLTRIDNIIDNPTGAFEQADGATAYIQKVGRNSYDLVVVGENGVATVMANKTRQELRNLAHNFGWEDFGW
jgi:hypothetical protein